MVNSLMGQVNRMTDSNAGSGGEIGLPCPGRVPS